MPVNHAARLRVPLGIIIGLIASAAVLSVLDSRGGSSSSHRPDSGPLLSDCEGTIRELVIHYVDDAAQIVLPTYTDFLRQLPPGVVVHVVCPRRADFDALTRRVGSVECVLSPIVVDHAITTWSRDRWLALSPSEDGDPVTLLSPRGELGAEIWPARKGDQRVAADLATALGATVAVRQSGLYFDGGDFVADRHTAFVTPAVLQRNLQQTVGTREELIARLSAALKRRVVLLREAPEHHAGMFMMPLGDRSVLVGDPSAARAILANESDDLVGGLCLPEGPDFSDATQALFDAVAEQCASAGYRVVRIPIVPGRNAKRYVTHLNAILDQRDGQRIVYMPVFSDVEVLNRAAEAVWSDWGYEVRRINCDAAAPHFGTLRCLVNVLRRDPAGESPQ